jgi:3-oxoacyl-[acyl-carrier-protein] synthase III
MTTSRILGTGHYVPDKVVTNFDLMKIMDTSNEFIVERTGVHRRRHAPPETAASDLGVLAAQAAVADAGLQMKDIELLIVNTITPDHRNPPAMRRADLRAGDCRQLHQGGSVPARAHRLHGSVVEAD